MDAPSSEAQNASMDYTEKQETVDQVTARLAARYPETPRHVIAGVVAEKYDELDTGRIRTYIPTLVEHEARDRLHRGVLRQPIDS